MKRDENREREIQRDENRSKKDKIDINIRERNIFIEK